MKPLFSGLLTKAGVHVTKRRVVTADPTRFAISRVLFDARLCTELSLHAALVHLERGIRIEVHRGAAGLDGREQ